jgi:hypothetical protein
MDGVVRFGLRAIRFRKVCVTASISNSGSRLLSKMLLRRPARFKEWIVCRLSLFGERQHMND